MTLGYIYLNQYQMTRSKLSRGGPFGPPLSYVLGNVITHEYDGNSYVTEYTYNSLDLVTNINYNGGKQVACQYNKVSVKFPPALPELRGNEKIQ